MGRFLKNITHSQSSKKPAWELLTWTAILDSAQRQPVKLKGNIWYRWKPQRVEEISGVPKEKLRAAADILGSTKSLVSTVLEGVYQTNQATAAAVQVNNLNLIRGFREVTVISFAISRYWCY